MPPGPVESGSGALWPFLNLQVWRPPSDLSSELGAGTERRPLSPGCPERREQTGGKGDLTQETGTGVVRGKDGRVQWVKLEPG